MCQLQVLDNWPRQYIDFWFLPTVCIRHMNTFKFIFVLVYRIFYNWLNHYSSNTQPGTIRASLSTIETLGKFNLSGLQSTDFMHTEAVPCYRTIHKHIIQYITLFLKGMASYIAIATVCILLFLQAIPYANICIW